MLAHVNLFISDMKARYLVWSAALLLSVAVAGIVYVIGRGGSVEHDEAIVSSPSGASGSVSQPSAVKRPSNVQSRKRRVASKGMGRIQTQSVEDDDDDDDMSPADRRLLTAIEEGRDDDDLDKILAVLPEASASTNVEVRSELVDALGLLGVPAMNYLLPFMADADDDVRQSAIDSWTSSLGEIEDEKMKAGLITAVMQVLTDEDALESMTSELIGMDEKIALQALVDIIEGGKAPKQAVSAAKEQYEFLTGDEYTNVEDANKWLAENYEPPDHDNAVKK